MIKGSFILIISLALLSPLPFVSPWYESAHAQVNKSTTGPPAFVRQYVWLDLFAKIQMWSNSQGFRSV